MSTLYLIDVHNTVLASSPINDTVTSPSDYSTAIPLRGSFAVRVPFDVPLEGLPQNLGDLITKKYTAILEMYPGYQYMTYDEQVDAVGWNLTPTLPGGNFIGTVGERQVNSIIAAGTLESNTIALSSTPQTCILRWEVFQYTYSEDTSVQGQRFYQETDSTWSIAIVTFNGGVTWSSVPNGVVYSIPLADQGNSFRVAFQRVGPLPRIHLGGWALIY